jgi:hypothetical protein
MIGRIACWVSVVFVATTAVGCGSSTGQGGAGTGGTSNAGGASSGGKSAGTGGGSSVGTGGSSAGTGGKSAGAGGGSNAGTPTCAAYCDAIMKNCVGGDGTKGDSGPNGANTHQQYTSNDNCLAACKAFPVGTAADTSGNTLGCRAHEASLAATDTTKCAAAGPGGDGVCGKACDGYCQLVAMFCTGASKIYADDAACHTRCAATANDEKFDIGIQDGNHVACLLYHAQEAPLDPLDHCVGDLTPADAGVSYGSITCK